MSGRPRIAVRARRLEEAARSGNGHDHFARVALSPFVEWVVIDPTAPAPAGAAPLAVDGCILDDGAAGDVAAFAAALRERLHGVPLCEESWLQNDDRRDVFLAQLFTHHRLRTRLAADDSLRALLDFHADHKLLYMAHSPSRQHALGRLIARGGERRADVAERYRLAAMATLAVPASRGKHANVLEHILGYFKRVLSASEKRELVAAIAAHRAGTHELGVPRTLLFDRLRRHQADEWLARQVYWEPYPPAIGAAAAVA